MLSPFLLFLLLFSPVLSSALLFPPVLTSPLLSSPGDPDSVHFRLIFGPLSDPFWVPLRVPFGVRNRPENDPHLRLAKNGHEVGSSLRKRRVAPTRHTAPPPLKLPSSLPLKGKASQQLQLAPSASFRNRPLPTPRPHNSRISSRGPPANIVPLSNKGHACRGSHSVFSRSPC